MVTSTGVQLYRWYEMGVTDLEDLQWLLQFYKNDTWPLSIIASALTEAKRYVSSL